MSYIFNFIKTNSSQLNFYFGSDQNINFNFTGGDYTPSSNFEFLTLLTFSILKGSTNNFSSIWVLNNRLYITSSNVLNVVALSDNSLDDWYSQAHAGRGNEELTNSGVVDTNVT